MIPRFLQAVDGQGSSASERKGRRDSDQQHRLARGVDHRAPVAAGERESSLIGEIVTHSLLPTAALFVRTPYVRE